MDRARHRSGGSLLPRARVAGCSQERRRVPLPVPRAEYLGIDVLAFDSGTGWRRPVAAFELENSERDDLVSYALWKACTVSVPLATVLCYRRRPEEVGALMELLGREVLAPLAPEAEVVVVVGTRSTARLFPDGFFRRFRWDPPARRLAAWV